MAATVTYQWPVANTTVAPTAAQTAYLVQGTLAWLDADTTATITHNFGLSAAEITALFPAVELVYDSTNAGTVNGVISVVSTANVLTFAKASAAGTGGTLRFSLQKYQSVTR